MQLAIYQNGLNTLQIKREVDSKTPLRLELHYSKTLSNYTRFISFESRGTFCELNLGIPFGELFDLSCISRVPIYIDNHLDTSNLIRSNLSAFLVQNNIEDLQPSSENGTYLVIYKNCLLLKFSPCIKESLYLFNVVNSFFILTDINYKLKAILLKDLTTADNQNLKEFLKETPTNYSPQDTFPVGGSMKLAFSQNIFEKILSLQQIDIWELLYDGLNKKIIDSDFIVYFAELYLEQANSHDLALKIAGITEENYQQIPSLFNDFFQQKSKKNSSEVNNKIWFYMSSIQGLESEGIL